MAAVAGASPVTITVRTPNSCNSRTSAAESCARRVAQRDEARQFHRAAVRLQPPGRETPAPRAPSRPPPRSATECARPVTTAKAPFTMRCVAPLESVALASDIFFAGSNGTNCDQLRCIGSRLGRRGGTNRAIDRDPGRHRNWPVRPAPEHAPHRSQPWDERSSPSARSGSACRSCRHIRHRSFPLHPPRRGESEARRALPSARAPSAAASVKVAGSATGIDARMAVKTRGTISASGILRK